MRLREVLAVFLALVGMWGVLRDALFAFTIAIQFPRILPIQALALMSTVAAALLVWQRHAAARMILGRPGATTVIDHRALLAAGCGALGAQQLLSLLSGMGWDLATLENWDPAWAVRYYGPRFLLCVFFLGAARWIPFLVGWGALNSGSFEDDLA